MFETKKKMHPQRGAKEFPSWKSSYPDIFRGIVCHWLFWVMTYPHWTIEIVLNLRSSDWIWLICQSMLAMPKEAYVVSWKCGRL